jgi:hypothetical protein
MKWSKRYNKLMLHLISENEYYVLMSKLVSGPSISTEGCNMWCSWLKQWTTCLMSRKSGSPLQFRKKNSNWFHLFSRDYLLSIRGLGLKSVECVRLLTLHQLAFPVNYFCSSSFGSPAVIFIFTHQCFGHSGWHQCWADMCKARLGAYPTSSWISSITSPRAVSVLHFLNIYFVMYFKINFLIFFLFGCQRYPVLETIQKYLWPRLCKLDQKTL